MQINTRHFITDHTHFVVWVDDNFSMKWAQEISAQINKRREVYKSKEKRKGGKDSCLQKLSSNNQKHEKH